MALQEKANEKYLPWPVYYVITTFSLRSVPSECLICDCKLTYQLTNMKLAFIWYRHTISRSVIWPFYRCLIWAAWLMVFFLVGQVSGQCRQLQDFTVVAVRVRCWRHWIWKWINSSWNVSITSAIPDWRRMNIENVLITWLFCASVTMKNLMYDVTATATQVSLMFCSI